MRIKINMRLLMKWYNSVLINCKWKFNEGKTKLNNYAI